MSKSTMVELYDVQVEDNMDGGLTIEVNISSPNVVYRFVAPVQGHQMVVDTETLKDLYAKRVAREYTKRIYEAVKDAIGKHLENQQTDED